MISTSRGYTLSMSMTLPFEKCLKLLRQSVRREGFQVVAEIPFHLEFERQLGLPWTKYTVLVVWSPFLAYQALLSERDVGMFMPFHFVLVEEENSTLIVAPDHSLLGRVVGKVGVVFLARHLTQKIRLIFSELSAQENQTTNVATPALGKEAS